MIKVKKYIICFETAVSAVNCRKKGPTALYLNIAGQRVWSTLTAVSALITL